MTLELLNQYDVTEQYSTDASDTASLTDVFGILVRERRYKINDGKSALNPFAAGSLFNSTNWRNGRIFERDAAGNTIYDASINDVGYEYSESSKTTTISARDAFGVLKEWTVEELLLKSESGLANRYRTTANYNRQFAGNIALATFGAPPLPAVGDIVSFSPDIVPRYQIVAVLTPPLRIQLDRPLEVNVAANSVLRLMSPVVKSGAAAVRDALVAAGVTKIGASFSVLDAEDVAAGRLLRLFVRRENKVKLTDHINKLLDMTDSFLTIDNSGTVNIFRGMAYSGNVVFEELTDSEIMLPVSISYERSRLLYGYDTLYISATRPTVLVASGTVSNDILAAYAARERWQPVAAQDESALSYQYLYANLASAQHFGQRKLDYYSRPRARLTCALKGAYSQSPNRKIDVVIGKEFLLTLRFSDEKKLHREPARVVSYTYDNERQFYSQVVFELTNWLWPALQVQ